MVEEETGTAIEQIEEAEETPKPPNPPGRPRKDGLPAGSVAGGKSDVALCPNPRFRRYISDDPNPMKRTEKLWKWWAELPETFRNLMSAYVYRVYPPLLPPNKEDGYKYIDVVVTPFENDLQLTDMYGAGTYQVWLNIGEKENKRSLAEAEVRGHRDFKSQPPSDKRITQLDADGKPKWIDVNDPLCRSYVEFLRSRGVLPEVWAEERKQKEMAEATMMEQVMQQNRDLTKQLVDDKRDSRSAPAIPLEDTVGRVIDSAMSGAKASQDMLKDTISTLQQMQLNNGNNGQSNVTDMMKLALDIADKISKSNDATPYLKIIGELNESMMKLQMDRMNDKIDSIRAATQQNQASGPAPNPAASIRSMIEDFKAVQELVGGGSDDSPTTAKMPAWMGLITALAQPASQIVGNIVNAYIVSRMPPGQAPIPQAPVQPPQAPPQPVTQPMHPMGQPPQPYNPVPTGTGMALSTAPTTTPLPNPMNPAFSPANSPSPLPQVDAVAQLMSTISGPFLNMFNDGQGGDDFADWFIGGYGEELYREITVAWPRRLALPADRALLMAIDNYPPMAQALIQEPKEQVEKFVGEFVGFDAEAYDRKNAGQGQGPKPVA